MGALYDYFRAADPAAVAGLMDRNDAASPADLDEWPTPVVELKQIDPTVVLGQLIGFIDPSAHGGTGDRLVWPAGGEQDTDHEGPWVTLLPDTMRDTLAAFDHARLPEVADRWIRVEEFGDYRDGDDEFAADTITELTGLARAARDAGEHLFCWMSL
ncbi:hypothetical protein [Actinoplanes utahensis]|uniref:DUF1877 domain-containing protein n=1 Tax=Actinoplanes utahensis TaxID=1869 RepID=A0A0A6XD46_ACTUT|nr:hypothetical protein [Actinoplanes utahensis]KHD78022.1 hypothetical protein MB27_07935 [Actinoplanes utahensis]GIF30026.1 hypothetical protein Aut01nite_30120 [Actinoplanes utahensis]